ncbi:unnamed protein product [Lactuca saligna]|uniref:Uncharacterized protein n=1 Tax=Lactuca saligna TaxID=75948 RepID=A0AA35Z6L8_LACSI|nr:unnamed protein product [Lactuca saligna]
MVPCRWSSHTFTDISIVFDEIYVVHFPDEQTVPMVIAIGLSSCDYTYDSSLDHGNLRVETLLQKLEEFVIKDEELNKQESVDRIGSTLLSGYLSMALCYMLPLCIQFFLLKDQWCVYIHVLFGHNILHSCNRDWNGMMYTKYLTTYNLINREGDFSDLLIDFQFGHHQFYFRSLFKSQIISDQLEIGRKKKRKAKETKSRNLQDTAKKSSGGAKEELQVSKAASAQQ